MIFFKFKMKSSQKEIKLYLNNSNTKKYIKKKNKILKKTIIVFRNKNQRKYKKSQRRTQNIMKIMIHKMKLFKIKLIRMT